MNNILFLGAGAFGFAMMKQVNLQENNIYAYDIDTQVMDSLKKDASHPYFFPGVHLQEVHIVDDIAEVLPTIDIVVIVIPVQHVQGALQNLKRYLKKDVIFLNLSKGIDTTTWQSISQLMQDILKDHPYTYAMLSGGMIAHDVIDGTSVGATLASTDATTLSVLGDIFQHDHLDIISSSEVLGVEIVSSLKNVMAIILGYYQGQGLSWSGIARYFVTCTQEMQDILIELTGEKQEIASYAFLGDMIATSLGDGRNRQFGEMIGKGIPVGEALALLAEQKKYAEGYYTLKAVYDLVHEKEGFALTKYFYSLLYTSD